MNDKNRPRETADQTEVIQFLETPASYVGVDRIERVETHGNIVFLAGAEAWKIKRAVRFPYMDFSTLEKRRVACTHEVAINRRFSADLYLGCVAITRTANGDLSFTGDGEPVEWAVHMRRFDQSALLSSLASRGPIPPDIGKNLADVVIASHTVAERRTPSSGSASIRDLVSSIRASLIQSSDVDATDVTHLADKLQSEIDRVAALLDERASHGFVRRCHGDLHLANVVLWHERLILYDAIEFDDTIATIDTLYDLAFLLMDLDRHGQRPTANIVLNRYLWRSHETLDLKGLAALSLFMALRAAIRAMVTIDRAAQEDGCDRQRDVDRARDYVRAALHYVGPSAPRLIVIGGLSGTGKTTLAATLAPLVGGAPGAVHFRSDLERKTLAGVDELDRLPASTYTREASARVYDVLASKAKIALSAGRSVIIDAVYATSEERCAIESIAVALGVPFAGLWLTADAATLVARVDARENDASDATSEIVNAQTRYYIGVMSPAWTTINAGGTPDQTLKLASSHLDLDS